MQSASAADPKTQSYFDPSRLSVAPADRSHRLDPPKSLIERGVRALGDGLESLVVRMSIHGDPPFYDTSLFPWVREVEGEWRLIRTELDRIMPERDRLPNFHDILEPVRTITTDSQWKTFWLAAIGVDCAENQRRFPETMRILNRIPGMKNAFFSILSPGKYIPPHRGAYNGILRYHLGLIVPEPKERCRIRVAREVRHWEEGKSLVFDDTYNHEVWNETEGTRVVLFVDFTRPLKGAFNTLNERMISMGAMAPMMREANDNLQQWSKEFYGRDN